MFGKRVKLPGIPVMHYQGLKGFPQDFPCSIELSGESIVFHKVNPEVTVTLPLNKVTLIDMMEEENYQVMYHNVKASTAKLGVKWYYVIKYQGADGPAHIDIWTTPGKTTREMEKIMNAVTAAQPESTSYTL